MKRFSTSKRRMIALLSAAIGLLCCLLLPASLAQQSPPVEVFEQVWQTVRDNFYDPKFNGVDWQAARQKYRSQAAKTQSSEALAIVINQMLAELKTSHTRYYTPAEPAYYQLSSIFRLQQSLKPFLPQGKLEYSGMGAFTQEINGNLFVSAILNNSPAEKAGLRVGDRLLSVDDKPFQPVRSFANAGQPVQVKIQRTANPTSIQTIALTPQRLNPDTLFLDAMQASAEILQRDGKKLAYIHIWSYADQKYQDLLEEQLTTRFREADALIWDLRDGWGGASPDYLSVFTGNTPNVILIGRDGRRRQYETQWKKPVVLLVNQGSRSGKEILAYGFRKFRVGTIVGTQTAGAVVAGRGFVMKDGSLLYLAVADVLVDGDRLEGTGVAPDIEVPVTLEYAQGADPQKEQAIQVALKAVR